MHDRLNVLMLCRESESSRFVFNGVSQFADIERIFVESPVPKRQLFRRRARKLGTSVALGQLAFMGTNRLLKPFSIKKKNQVIARLGLDDMPLPSDRVTHFSSINNEEVIRCALRHKPDVVLVNGTRIIKRPLLEALPCPVINTHLGITPKYRGVHGGYWAVANGDLENCGVTIHLVDSGVDTGRILYQERIDVDPSDTFDIYPVKQVAAAIPLLEKAFQDIAAKREVGLEGGGPSNLWFHPTLGGYLMRRILHGAK